MGRVLWGGGIEQIIKKRTHGYDNSVVILVGEGWVEMEEDIGRINGDGEKKNPAFLNIGF